MTFIIGKKAPHFVAKAAVKESIVEDFSLSTLEGDYVILFFYPLDFTFVCPTELHAFQEKLEEFKEKSAHIVGCSIDSIYSHHAWLQTPRAKGGILGVEFPLISDITKEISRNYGVLDETLGVAYRGLFLIDKEGIIRHQLINDLPLGRSVNETLRLLDALIYYENHGEVCPANWNKGKDAIVPTKKGLETYFSLN